MFSALSDKLTSVLKSLAGRGVLTEEAVTEGLREIRRVLLEADVSFELSRAFTERVREKAIGVTALKAVNPGQQIVKIVHDELAELLGGAQAPLKHASVPPTVILLVGLQGSGKTTTAAKLAARLKKEQKAPYLVAADVYRPAAEEQLRQLGARVTVDVFGPSNAKSADVVEIVKAGIKEAGHARARTVIVDTAGRLQIDDEMMAELKRLKDAVKPHEILLVADAMTGQDAVRIAKGFHDALGISGVILTKLDGDARGGAALSIHGVTGAPIKYVGVGERVDALDVFDPRRMAGRILQQGDVVALVERAQETVDVEQAEKLQKKAFSKKGMDLQDFLGAMRQVQGMGSISSIMGMLPGVNAGALKGVNVDDKKIKHVEAIVLSMTPDERKRPDILNGPRKVRIARGSGRTVQEVNTLIKQFEQMKKMMKGFGGMMGMLKGFGRKG